MKQTETESAIFCVNLGHASLARIEKQNNDNTAILFRPKFTPLTDFCKPGTADVGVS